MKPNTLRRIIIITALIALNIYLGRIFMSQAGINWSAQAARLLAMIGVVPLPQEIKQSLSREVEYKLNNEELFAEVNKIRQAENLPTLTHLGKLDQVAGEMITVFGQQQYQIENKDYGSELVTLLKRVGYEHEVMSNVAIVGPLSNEEILQAWLQEEEQRKNILSKEFIDAGIAVREVDINGQKAGVAVLVLAKVCLTTPPPLPSGAAAISTPPAREVPDDEVVNALNQYRGTHGVHQLITDQNLCEYASKRVKDLQAYGGLDSHEGFKKDFADLNNLPESIKRYSGGTIGENLASQYCINGTTGKPFAATTGTALIEWCFDSSTKGHREAQLNPRYNAVCSRHGSNMYVVIFGE